MLAIQKIVPCLWFDNQAEEAAKYYVAIFERSRISRIVRSAREANGRDAGSVMTVAFELEGQPFTAVNGGALFRFNQAISLQVMCETQEEIDRYWRALSAGADERGLKCGWLKDRYGLFWQIIPALLPDFLGDQDPGVAGRVMQAMLGMKKLDIAGLKQAYAG